MDLNRVMIVGEVADEIKINQTKAGNPVGRLTVLTQENFKAKDGRDVTTKAFHKVTVWGDDALVGQALSVGDRVLVEGSMKYGSYEKDGHKVPTAEINVGFADKFIPLSGGVMASAGMDNDEASIFS